jgi:hypothetical protein
MLTRGRIDNIKVTFDRIRKGSYRFLPLTKDGSYSLL